MSTIQVVTSGEGFQACLSLRREVFIDEQGVSEADELDDRDPECVHFLALPTASAPFAEAVGTARLLETEEGQAKAQRVAVRRAARRQNIGRLLMTAVEDEARRRGFRELLLSAQLTAIPFYERLGYVAHGAPYDDAGILHRDMSKVL